MLQRSSTNLSLSRLRAEASFLAGWIAGGPERSYNLHVVSGLFDGLNFLDLPILQATQTAAELPA